MIVTVNEAGLRIGEGHPNAKLPDREVDLIRQLRADGMTYALLAEKFEVSKGCVAKLCRYESRAQTVADLKVVPVSRVG